MNIKFQNTQRNENKCAIKTISPLKSSYSFQLSDFKHEYYKKRPLETSYKNLSFKGLFYKPVFIEKTKIVKKFDSNKIIKTAKETLGESAEDLFKSLKQNLANKTTNAEKLIKIDENGIVTFQKKTVLRLIIDGIAYPFITLPIDILNGTLKKLQKVKPLKNLAENAYNSSLLKNSRQRSKLESKVNSLRGLFETVEKNKMGDITSELFQGSAKRFDAKTGNYDTKHERSLCRIVSGFFPAIFLANDAYNLSMMYNNNTKDAEKERKSRFKQEVVRVGSNAYLTLITLGALQKYINNSKLGIILNTGLTVLFTESMARLASGKSLTRLTPEQAKTINAKNNNESEKIQDSQSTQVNTVQKNSPKEVTREPLLSFNTLLKASAFVIATGFGIKGLRKAKAIDNLYKGVTEPFKNLYKNLVFDSNSKIKKQEFEQVIKSLEEVGVKEYAKIYRSVSESANKLYALKTLEKEMPKQFNGLLDGFRKEKFMQCADDIDSEKFFNGLSPEIESWSKKLVDKYLSETTKYNVDDFIAYIKNVSKNGSKVLPEDLVNISSYMANKYEKIYSGINDSEFIHLGQKDKKIKPLVDFVIAPFKFMFGVVKFPYTISEKILEMFAKKKGIKFPPSIEENNVKALAISIDKITKASKKMGNTQDFKTYINDNIAKAFNVDNMSNIANSELANLAKTSATAATIWFLMTDNYNMAMLKSNGEDVDGAKEKFKARFVQEGSRLFYQTMLIDLFNSTFRTQYHNSLFGMSWITAMNTLLGEVLNRKSIGMPVLPHNKEELNAIEIKKQNATGFLKSYYNFMARLTGKKTLSEQSLSKKK